MTDIVTCPIGTIPNINIDSGGLFTPGAAYSIKLNADIINAVWNLASTKTDAFDAKINALTADVTGWLATHAAVNVSAGTISAPTPTEPSMTISDVSPALVVSDITTQVGTVLSTLASKFSSFLSTWFPSEASAYGAAESWITAAIGNTTTGAIPASIKAAMLADGQAQILADQTRALADNDEAWAARRHALPTGAQQYQAMRIAQGAQDAISSLSRTIAIKDFDMTFQKAIEAVRLALQNRQAALNAALEYMQEAVAGYSAGNHIAGSAYEAQARMISTAGQYFASRISAAELSLKASQANQSLQFEAARTNQTKAMQDIDNYLKVFLAQGQMLAHQVSAMLNNVRAGGSSSYSVST